MHKSAHLYSTLVSSCANESQNQRNCLLSSHVIIQLIFNTEKQRYIYSKQTKKSENKDTVIKFLLSCNIRSLCNTAHCSERYVPTTGHRRQNTRINILINGSATTVLLCWHTRRVLDGFMRTKAVQAYGLQLHLFPVDLPHSLLRSP